MPNSADCSVSSCGRIANARSLRERARRILAEFRADYSRGFRDARVRELVEHLRRNSALFAEAWEGQAVEYRAGGSRSFFAGAGQVVRYTQHTYLPQERSDHKVVVLVPE